MEQKKLLDIIYSFLLEQDLKNEFLNLEQNEILHILKIIQKHRLESLFLKFLLINNLTEVINADHLEYLKRISAFQTIHSKRLINESLRIAKIFNENQIDYVFIKGISFKVNYYKENSYIRNTRDIDILIHNNDFMKISNLLYNYGYDIDSRFENNILDSEYAFPRLSNHFGQIIELHHKIIHNKDNEECILSKNILKNPAIKKIEGVDVNISENEHLIMHLIYHGTSKNNFDNGPLLIKDINSLIKDSSLNMNKLLCASKKYSLNKELALIFSIINNYTNNNIDLNIKITNNMLEDIKEILVLNNLSTFENNVSNNKFLQKSTKSFFKNIRYLAKNKSIWDIFKYLIKYINAKIATIFNHESRRQIKKIKKINNFLG